MKAPHYRRGVALVLIAAGTVVTFGCQTAAEPAPPAPSGVRVAKASPTPAPGATVTGTIEIPADNVAYRVQQDNAPPLALRPAAGARVFLADASGNPLPGLPEARTDGQGRFTLNKVPPSYSYVVVAEISTATAKPAQYRSVTKVSDLGATVKVDPASTLVTSAVLDGMSGDLGEFNPSRFQMLKDRIASLLRATDLPDFSDGLRVRDHVRELVKANDELRATLAKVQEDLRKVQDDVESLRTRLEREQAAPSETPATTDGGTGATPDPTDAGTDTTPATPVPNPQAPNASTAPTPVAERTPIPASVPSPKAEDFLWLRPEVPTPGLTYRTFNSKAAGSEVNFYVYTPPTYQSETTRRFPVMYWLHGTGGGDGGQGQLARVIDNAIKARKIPPMLVVFPNGLPRGMWVDSKDGARKVEGMFIDDLIPLVDREYRTQGTRSGRLVEGFSMGGYGAGRLGFKHHTLFAGISMFAGGPLDLEFEGARASSEPDAREFLMAYVYGGDLSHYQAVSPRRIAEQNVEVLKTFGPLRVIIGDQDFTYGKNKDFHEHLEKLGIPHDYRVISGVSHDMPKLIMGLGEDNWAFYRRVFGNP